MEFVYRDRHERRVPAIDVYPEDLEVLATIRFSRATGWAGPAEIVGLYCAKIALGKITAFRSGNDLHTKLMTESARIAEKRLLAGERVNVRATNATAVHTDQRFTNRRNRRGDFCPSQHAGFFERE